MKDKLREIVRPFFKGRGSEDKVSDLVIRLEAFYTELLKKESKPKHTGAVVMTHSASTQRPDGTYINKPQEL